MPSYAAIIVAAGTSSRLPGEVPKVYRQLSGRSVLRHSVDIFQTHPAVDQLLVVVNPEHLELYHHAMGGASVMEPIAGGATRQESVYNGLKALAECAPDYVLIHDAARPGLDRALLDRLIGAVQTHDAVIPGIAVADTIKQVDNGKVKHTPNRDLLVAVQTPQAFNYPTILAAHKQLEGLSLSDDAAVAEAAGMSVHVVKGAHTNFKLTRIEDWQRMQQMQPRSSMGFDVHRLEENGDKPLMLCGVAIDSPLALVGHSDADVGLHALVDALLGAIAAGDIGQHFPPSDEKWKGCDSSHFVRHALTLVKEKGGELQHLDLTIICEQPKLGSYRKRMRQHVAELVGLPLDAVSLKATTTEKLGFTGRGEGIAAQCVVTVNVPIAGSA